MDPTHAELQKLTHAVYAYIHALLQAWMDPVKFPNTSNCSLALKGWEELLAQYNSGKFKFTSGGLGPSRLHHVYLTWVCLKGTIPWPSDR
jgi:hypothetical protein